MTTQATQVVSSKRTDRDWKPHVKSSPTLSDQLLGFFFSSIHFLSFISSPLFLSASPFVFLLSKPESLNPSLVQGSLSDFFSFSFVQL